jgi:hypothetical protein
VDRPPDTIHTLQDAPTPQMLYGASATGASTYGPNISRHSKLDKTSPCACCVHITSESPRPACGIHPLTAAGAYRAVLASNKTLPPTYCSERVATGALMSVLTCTIGGVYAVGLMPTVSLSEQWWLRIHAMKSHIADHVVHYGTHTCHHKLPACCSTIH